MDPTLQSTLYRLARESVTNAVRHARGASKIAVRIVGDDSTVRLTVSDDGKAVEGRAEAGFGLRGMKERVTLLGGQLTAGPGRRHGWVVAAELPKHGAAA